MALCTDPLKRHCMHAVLSDGMVCDDCWEEKHRPDSNQESLARAEAKRNASAVAALYMGENTDRGFMARAYLDFEAKLMALREALAEACVEWEAWMSKGLDVEE